jgi:hypothetical protein
MSMTATTSVSLDVAELGVDLAGEGLNGRRIWRANDFGEFLERIVGLRRHCVVKEEVVKEIHGEKEG